MNKSNKYLIWAAVILITFIVVICFAGEIQMWLKSRLTELVIIASAFVAGWLLGHFGRKQKNIE